MSKIENAIWGMHAGKTGDADSLFLHQNRIALGWRNVGDLSGIKPDREAFKNRVGAVYPDLKPGAKINSASQLFRFVHEMNDGDLVCYPSKADRQIHIGRVTGSYRYDPTASPNYPQQRPVEWIRSVARTSFSQGALYEIGSALSLFQLRNYADEFRRAIAGEFAAIPTVEDDETIPLVTEEIGETTKDFVLKRLATELKGHAFAEFVAHLLGTMGYRTRVSPEGPDGGVDVIAHRDELGFEPPIVKVQVKSTEGSVGDPIVSQLYGKLTGSEYGLLVTLGTFTAQAKTFARNRHNLRLLDGDDLVDLVFQHYEQFDSRYKGVLPLKRIYVPESIDDID
ncbi:MAG TPA: restriction endonuclease [Pyrinomonadaceae bacterium]|nr:restriction endonuclease [Pyrinomonadaceae bacterium]